MTVRANEIVGGTPTGGSNGDIIVRDNSVPGGYVWGPNPGTPVKIQSSVDNTSLTVIESLSDVNFPWSNNGTPAIEGFLGADSFLKISGRNAAADPEVYPGESGDVIVRFSSGVSAVHLQADTVSGRDLVEDGAKLDNISAGAQANYAVLSEEEKADPSLVNTLRSFTPRDVVDIATGLEIGNYPKVTVEEISNAAETLANRTFSPSDIHGIFDVNNDGEPNPTQINNSEIADPGNYSTTRSFAPNDVRRIVDGMFTIGSSGQRVIPGAGGGDIYWDHGIEETPTTWQVLMHCVVPDQTYSIGDVVALEYAQRALDFSVLFQPTRFAYLKGTQMPVLRAKGGIYSIIPDPDKWRIELRAMWISI